MEGQDFIDKVGGIKNVMRGGIEVEEIVNPITFDNIAEKLKVIARCSPEAKYCLVKGLTEESIVAVTGKDTADVRALMKGDIGLSLSEKMGTEVAKDAADINLVIESMDSIL